MADNARDEIVHQFATIIPTLRYRDASAAVDWLCQAFGFEKHLVVSNDDGTIAHAELVFGNGMVMLGAVREDEFGRLQQPPSQADGVVTQSPYILVEDVDKHYERAVAAGAQIVMELKDQDYGGRDYSCRDPEGHVWNFGTYDPWNAG
ncbi:VOC family protein [Nodosilinea sp. LEGE 07088]|uniref:VOC family protein n=1 Tax=Nodosilinea sp. LEGE 07088 TaxID=2777968 RepID=UPI0018826D96|nr:VOC family protein [Nodosilinea sp. LEGE 07088]MBE9138257.1 VOC family protein [Nodosilinea sp. LEGE 07088]